MECCTRLQGEDVKEGVPVQTEQPELACLGRQKESSSRWPRHRQTAADSAQATLQRMQGRVR